MIHFDRMKAHEEQMRRQEGKLQALYDMRALIEPQIRMLEELLGKPPSREGLDGER